MSFLSMMEARLPPGFRFHPRDDELICDYLANKASAGGNHSFYGCPMLVDVDLNKVEPWDLPEMACVGGKEWYFFSLRDRKYATGQRTNRATLSGYWKATGKDRLVSRSRVLVGMRKTLVFYQGRAPKGKKTEWVMHEFRSESRGDSPQKFCFKEDWVLCRVFYKSRGIAVKPSTEMHFERTAAASSLPPLMDTYMSFEQAPPPSIEGIEQVPCFSNYQASNNNTSVQHLLATDRVLPSKSLAHSAGLPDVASYVNQLACDNKVIQAVLSHLTKVESSQKEEVQFNHTEGSSESYLTETGFTSMWNEF